MADFGQLKKLKVKNKAIEYKLYAVDGEPSLHVLPASEANKPYFNALLKRQRKTLRATKNGASINAGLVAENRDEDRELYAKHILIGWANVVDADDKIVDFSTDNARDFLSALPNWIFDDLRAFASEPSNWLDEDRVDVEELAGN